MSCISGSTGETVNVAGTYRDNNLICAETPTFSVGDTFTPCTKGGAVTWTLVH